MHASIHSYVFIHPSILIIRSFINPFIQSFTNSPICLIIHQTIHSFIYSLIYSLIHTWNWQLLNYLGVEISIFCGSNKTPNKYDIKQCPFRSMFIKTTTQWNTTSIILFSISICFSNKDKSIIISIWKSYC